MQFATTTLVADDVEAVIRGLKDELAGEISVSGPELAGSLTELGLIDEYDSTSTPSCLVVASRSSPAHGRRSALSPAVELARPRSG